MDALEKLEEKINRAVALIEKLNKENEALIQENGDLKGRLDEYETKLNDMERQDLERSEVVKEKLTGILGKLETLEQI